MPLPPYIRGGEADAQDRADYQTMFAAQEARSPRPPPACTSRPSCWRRSRPPASRRASVTLHVGAGTFLPVRVDDTDAHTMHAEWGEVPAATARGRTRRRAPPAAASSRSAPRVAAHCWKRAARDRDGVVAAWTGETDIFITPGYRFRAVDLLLTNFHLPRSTLFMLVAAFAGLERMKAAYAHAMRERYRFYSYGDACCLMRR